MSDQATAPNLSVQKCSENVRLLDKFNRYKDILMRKFIKEWNNAKNIQ